MRGFRLPERRLQIVSKTTSMDTRFVTLTDVGANLLLSIDEKRMPSPATTGTHSTLTLELEVDQTRHFGEVRMREGGKRSWGETCGNEGSSSQNKSWRSAPTPLA